MTWSRDAQLIDTYKLEFSLCTHVNFNIKYSANSEIGLILVRLFLRSGPA